MASRNDKPESVLSASTLGNLTHVFAGMETLAVKYIFGFTHTSLLPRISTWEEPKSNRKSSCKATAHFKLNPRNLANTPLITTYQKQWLCFKKPPKSRQPPLTPAVAQIFPPTAHQALQSWVHLSNCWAWTRRCGMTHAVQHHTEMPRELPPVQHLPLQSSGQGLGKINETVKLQPRA